MLAGQHYRAGEHSQMPLERCTENTCRARCGKPLHRRGWPPRAARYSWNGGRTASAPSRTHGRGWSRSRPLGRLAARPRTVNETEEPVARALNAVDPVMSALTSGDVTRPSPCAGWTVGDVAAHLVAGMIRWTSSVPGTSPPPTDASAQRDDLAAAWQQARVALLDALRSAGPSATDSTPLLQIAPIEIMLHGWDVARGIGASTNLDSALAGELLERGRGLIAQFGRGSAFAEEQPAPETATAADRLAAFYGRVVS